MIHSNLQIEQNLTIKSLTHEVNTITTTLNGSSSLTASSAKYQKVTGSATGFSVVLPDATTLTIGAVFEIHNHASVSVALKDNGGTVLTTLAANTSVKVVALDISTSNGIFDTQYYLEPAEKAELELAREIAQDTLEPTGFLDRTECTISFNETTREFSIAPVSTSFSVYTQGTKLVISTTLTTTLSDTTQPNFIYINSGGTLSVANVFDLTLLSDYAYVAYILWDADDNKAVVFAEERHGITMDWATHSYLHTTRGAQLVSGGALSATLAGDGSSNSHAQIGLTNMTFADEDIRISIVDDPTPTNPFEQVLTSPAEIPILYRSGASGMWKKLTATTYPIKAGTNRAQFNYFNGSTWALADATTNDYYLASWVMATNDLNHPVVVILGQDEYVDLNDALTSATWNNLQQGTAPFQEFKVLYRLIYKTNSAYTNAVKAAIIDATDFRFGTDRGDSSSVSITDHGNLSGLSDDDHSQYLLVNGTRAMTGDLNMGSHNLTAAGTYNGVNVASHAARHAVGGADALSVGIPVSTGTANATGSATSFAASDHVHNTVISTYENRTVTGTTTTSATDTAILTITTPAAGSYVLDATIIASHSANGGTLVGSIYLGGSLVTNTKVTLTRPNASVPMTYNIRFVITPNGSQNIDLRWATGSATLTNILSHITLLKVG